MFVQIKDEISTVVRRLKDGATILKYEIGIEDYVKFICFSPDSKKIVILTYDPEYPDVSFAGNTTLVSLETGKKIHGLNSFNYDNALFSNDGSKVAMWSYSQEAIIWSVVTGEVMHHLKNPGNITDVCFSSNCSKILTACSQGTVIIWDVKTGKALATLNYNEVIYHTCFSTDEKLLAIAIYVDGENKSIVKLWSLETFACIQTFYHKSKVNGVEFNCKGTELLMAYSDGSAILWSIEDGNKLQTFYHLDEVNSAHFSPNEQFIVTSSNDMSVAIWRSS